MKTSPLRALVNLPVISGVLIVGLLVWMFATEHFARSMALMGLGILWLVATGLWWALRVPGQRWARLGKVVLAGVVLGIAAKFLVRREGSADGTALPKYSWRWSAPSTIDLPPLPDSAGAAAAIVTDPGPVPAGVADFLRFMGPLGDGVVPDAGLQMDWNAKAPREVWRIPVGLGWAGFAVAGRRAITQEQREAEEYVTCYDVATGALLWAHRDLARFSEAMGGDGPRTTPTIDLENGTVLSLGATGILNCLDLATGKKKWSRNILSESGVANLTWAKSAAPLLHGPHVIVSGGDSAPTLMALRRDNGEVVWKAGTDAASYSSPVLLTLAGQEQIVSVNKFSVTGHDPATGTVLWSFDWPGDMPKAAQPVAVGENRVLVTASYMLKSHLLEIARDASGKFACTVVWSSKSPRTKFSSPAVIGNHAYALDEGRLACVDLATGELTWRDGRYGFGQHLVVGNHLLIQTEPGDVVLVKANPEKLEEVGRIKALSSKTWNAPTLAGRYLLVRNDREAVCYEIPSK